MKKKQFLRMASLALASTLTMTTVLPAAAANEKVGATSPEKFDCSKNPNAYAIYPIPQTITYSSGNESFAMDPAKVTLVTEKDTNGKKGVDSHTTNYVKEVLQEYGITAKESATAVTGNTNIILGVKDVVGAADTYMKEKNIKQNDATLYDKEDAYLLDADATNKTIVIEGKDTDATFHGVSTLKMMFSSFSGKKFLDAHIEDYATVGVRGYIEGFYGAWDFTERANLMKFAKDYKMNSYVYAAKGDAYHTNRWAELYPDHMLKEFENLVKVGEETKVKFAWSVHLGSFFSGLTSTDSPEYKKRFDQLMRKFDQLYKIGVRRFDLLNDDFGSGSLDMVVTALNEINAALGAKGCEPVTYCMQGYNKGWALGKAGKHGQELEAMKRLDPAIHLYWTGDDVNWPITQETVTFVKDRTNHAPDYWLNYPVNEHAKSGIYLGDIRYYARDNVKGLAGFHSNPCRFAYANEVGLYQLASLVWNNNDYSKHTQEIWESAFNYLQPEVKDAYFTIAKNVSAAPGSSRVGNGFPESEYLTDTLKKVQDLIQTGGALKGNADVTKLISEFDAMIKAVADFRANCKNTDLVNELDPWLKSLHDIATAGKASLESLIASEEKNNDLAWANLSTATKHYSSMYTYLTATDLPGVYAKAGSKRLAPLVTIALNEAKTKLLPVLDPSGESLKPTLYAKLGGAIQSADANGKNMYDGSTDTASIWNTVQKVGDYVGLDFGGVIDVKDVTIVQGENDRDHNILHKARLEYSADGKEWKTLVDNSNGQADGHMVTWKGNSVKARYVRYYLVTEGHNGKPDYWTHVREFTVNKKEVVKDRVYTNVEALKATPLTLDGAEVSLRNLNGITLNQNQYVGIKFKQPVIATTFAKAFTQKPGLKLQYAFNESDWKDVTAATGDVGVKYFRLVNTSNAPVQTDVAKIGMTIRRLVAEPKFLSTTTKGLSSGSYAHIFDGDLSTFVVTKDEQVNGTSFTFDLGDVIEIHDVTAITSDGDQRFYNAKIEISENNSTWKSIATIQNGDCKLDPPFRYWTGDGNGQNARYMRITYTGNSNNSVKLFEIQLNQTAKAGEQAAQVVGNVVGNLNAIVDKDIATLVSANVKANDYVEYRLSENTNLTKVTVLQGKPGNGKVYAVTATGEKLLGTLNKSVNVLDVNGTEPVRAIRIKWDAAEEVALHELTCVYGPNKTTDIGTYVDPVVANPGEAVFENIAPLGTVAESGHTAGNKDNVKDGNLDTKWDSNFIKQGQNASAQDTGDAWISFDFGIDKQYEMNKLVVSYFNLIYPTSWIIQTSDDGQKWTNATETLTKANGGQSHPVETIEFKKPISARFVRLYFNTLNTAAAGNGVGIKEVEIYGREVKAVDKAELQAAIAAAQIKVQSADYTKASKDALNAAITEAQKVVDRTSATAAEVTEAVAALQAKVDALQKKITEQQNIGLNKPVTVSGTGNGQASYINDGKDTKWDSQNIKEGTGETAKDIGDAWFVIDLGETLNLIDGLKVDYFNKVYPTKYEVQISNDNTKWTTVKTLTRQHNGQTHPKDDIRFETPVSARYVKMLFEEVNNVAGGHGIGINDAQILGRYINEVATVESVGANADILTNKDAAFDITKLPAVNEISVKVDGIEQVLKALVPVSWKVEGIDTSKVTTYSLEGILSLNGIANNTKKATVNVVVQGPQTEELNYQALDVQLALAAEKEKVKDTFTTESYDVFKTAYENAQTVKASATTQKAIDEATTALDNAIKALQTKPPVPQKADKTALQAKVTEYSNLDSKQYTETSWKAFEKVLDEAKAVLADDHATQEAVNTAVKNLTDAFGRLDKITQPEPEVPQPEPETPQPEPETPQPEPETPQPEPETPQPEPETPQPQPETSQPTPQKPAPEKPNTNKPNTNKPVQTGDVTSVFGVMTSMMLAGGYVLGRKRKEDEK